MRAMYEFMCKSEHVQEKYIDSGVMEINCNKCLEKAERIVSAVRCKLDPISGDYPGATRKWEKNREHKLQQERKANP